MPPASASLRAALVEQLLKNGSLTQAAVAGAFRAVPRHRFLPDVPLEEVYRDEAIPTKLLAGQAISSSSQPAIMAIMLEQLDLSPGQRVLEIGAGAGYNAALLGYLVGPGGEVVSLDIDDDLVAGARAHLSAAGVRNVQVICADGGNGWPHGAPYDRIILTVGSWDIAPAWREQLRPGGKLVLPLGISATGPQKCVAFLKPREDGGPWLTSQSVRDCGFMRLRGAFAGPERLLSLGPEPGLDLSLSIEPPASPETLLGWLTQPGAWRSTGIEATAGEVTGGVGLWLGINSAGACDLIVQGDWSSLDLPYLFEVSARRRLRSTIGIATTTGLAFLSRPKPFGRAIQAADEHKPFELQIAGFGPENGAGPVSQMLAHSAAWRAAGRPGNPNLRVRVYPPNIPVQPGPKELVVGKNYTQLLIDWPVQSR